MSRVCDRTTCTEEYDSRVKFATGDYRAYCDDCLEQIKEHYALDVMHL